MATGLSLHRRSDAWLRHRFYQRCSKCVLQVLGQDLRPADARPLFLLRYFLCSRDDARLGPRYSDLESDITCHRLVSDGLLLGVSATLARSLLLGSACDTGAADRFDRRAGFAPQHEPT